MHNSLRNELNIAKNIDHPNIVKLYDFSETLNNFYLFFEFCDGNDLSEKMR